MIRASKPARRAAFVLACLPLTLLLTGCGGARPECAPPDTTVESDPGTTQAVADPTPDPGQIRILWETGPHAHSHLIDEANQDPDCARCHAPENWVLVEDETTSVTGTTHPVGLASPKAQPGVDWSPVGCAVCHPNGTDEKEGEIAWLEVASSVSYVPLESISELCEKCHLAADVEGHLSIVIRGSHENMQCTDCHDPHDASASCSGSGCHEPFAQECETIDAHIKPHLETSCSSCHDADSLKIGWNEVDLVWDTVLPAAEDGAPDRPYTSHALVLEVVCDRCHEPGNHPWGEIKE